jgi:hypothetical protein
MSNTPSNTEDETHRAQQHPLSSQWQPVQASAHHSAFLPAPQSLPPSQGPARPPSPSGLIPTTSPLEEQAPISRPSDAPDIVETLRSEATGGHRVGERVLRRSRRTRTNRRSSNPQSSSNIMVRPSPPALHSENDSDSDPGSKLSQSTAVSESRSETDLRPRRTRTLTTPHQAAVLHALLAQVGWLLPADQTAVSNQPRAESLPDYPNAGGSGTGHWNEREEGSGSSFSLVLVVPGRLIPTRFASIRFGFK